MNSKYPEEGLSLSETDWVDSESVRRVMLRSKAWGYAMVPSFLFIAALLYGSTNNTLILLWVTWMLVLFSYVIRIKIEYASSTLANNPEKKKIKVQRLGSAWFLMGLGWAMIGLVFFTSMSAQKQFLIAVALSFNVLLPILDLCRHQKIARSFINGMFGGLWVGSVFYLSAINHLDVSAMDYAYLLAMLFAWYFAFLFNRQLYRAFCRDLKLQFRNSQLIQELRQETIDLALEKKSALIANETIKRFFSSAAHDIRQPVYALNMYAAFLKDSPEKAAELIPKIKSSCRGINALFESLFEYEKVKSNQISVTMENTNLTTLVNELALIFKPVATSKNLSFRVKPLSAHLMIDSVLLKGVLSNLLSNAIKYTQTGGVLFCVRKLSDGISFEVWDTGIGIAASHHEHIFDEFYKVGEHSSADEGFGLGLSLAKRLATHIEGHRLTVHSRIGRGSVFKLYVPRLANLHLKHQKNTTLQPFDMLPKAISSSP
jgi:signal transduction histidine kinase